MMINFSFILWHVIVPACLLILAYMVENTFWKWKFYKSFSSWRELALQKLSKFGAKIINLKTIYIIFAVVVGFSLLILFIALYYQLSNIISGKAKTTISTIDSNFALAFLGTISGGVALFTGYMAILRSGTNERETRTAEEGLITERLTKATEGLGKKDGDNPVIEVRLGALYALERIAQDSIRDHIQIMEMLCAYIRTNRPLSTDPAKVIPISEDIQAALNIIGRRENWTEDKEHLKKEIKKGYRLDLRYCDLQEAQLIRANLRNAWLDDTNLRGARLINANLRNAWLNRADLRGANLSIADLRSARLNRADLRSARLNRADLRNAKLNNANMEYANLYEANISNAWLMKANMTYTNIINTNMENAVLRHAFAYNINFSKCLNFTLEQLESMFCRNNASLPNNWESPEHWPEKELPYNDFKVAWQQWRIRGKWNDLQLSLSLDNPKEQP